MDFKVAFLSVMLGLTLASSACAGVDFDLVDDYLTCGTTDDIMQENVALTISAWIYPRSDGEADAGSIVRKRTTGGVNFRMAVTDLLTFRVNGGTILNRTSS